MMCSICHGLVEETAFVHASCSCDVHRRCTLGFVEDAISRARADGARTLTPQVTSPNPALMRCTKRWTCTSFSTDPWFSGWADTAEEKAIDARLTETELRLSRSSTTLTGTVDLSRSANKRAEDIARD